MPQKTCKYHTITEHESQILEYEERVVDMKNIILFLKHDLCFHISNKPKTLYFSLAGKEYETKFKFVNKIDGPCVSDGVLVLISTIEYFVQGLQFKNKRHFIDSNKLGLGHRHCPYIYSFVLFSCISRSIYSQPQRLLYNKDL